MFRSRTVGALLAGALAVAAAPRGGFAGPDAVPEPLWWRAEAPGTLARSPLGVLERGGAFALESEWRPLYSDGEGARVEDARRFARLALPTRPRLAIEIEEEVGIARGGGARWIGAEQRRARRAALGGLANLRRLTIAAAFTAREDAEPGGTLEARAQIAPSWTAAGSWSRTPERGRLDVRRGEIDVSAPAAWRDHAVTATLEGRPGAFAARLRFEAIDRAPVASRGRDAVEPRLAWRESSGRLSTSFHGARWEIEGTHGIGRQALRVYRGRALYGVATGPIERSDVSLRVAGERARWQVHVAGGRWSGEVAGSAATWPFEEFTGATGTRLVARSSAALVHAGFAVDRVAAGSRPGWDGGLALWRLAPQASYRSWRATLFSVGRDDYQEGGADLRVAWLVGLRGAWQFGPPAWRTRLEAVQWIPVRIEREREDEGPPGGGAPGGGGGSSGSAARGGTIVRIAVSG